MLKTHYASTLPILVTLVIGTFTTRAQGDEDCLGIPIYPHSDSAVYSSLHPWIDTAADSAHFPADYPDTASQQGCSISGF